MKKRKGAILSFELLIVIPVIFGIVMAMVQFSFLISGSHRLKEASRQVARIASRPMTNLNQREKAIKRALTDALGNSELSSAVNMDIDHGQFTGDRVVVEMKLPMAEVSPDLLRVIGFSIRGRELCAITVMQKE